MHIPSSNQLPSTGGDALPPSAPEAFLRLPQVLARVPISRSTLWRRVQERTFPQPLKLSARVTVWRSRDIDGWMREQG
ncbi:AlpA family phage regulatory protein [Luteimonas sp. BDR2-5]|uniref:helix-turn-helix transcriptional regulator n=1 Tax=Proluteimonas luteida TaxID=2878685 RepID=UPI0031BC25AA|nr:AlpA family phage regulatory protein [Luteimonas sp. BDR2-5]